jgi:predicted ATPase
LIAETGGAGTPHGFSVLWGLCIANYVGANSYAALEQAREFLSIAQSQQETGPLVIGHRLLGTSLMINGDYPAALSHLERAVSLCTPEEHQTLAFQFGQDNRVSALCYWSMALWHRGYPDRADKAAGEALHYAKHCSHPYTLSYALFFNAMTAILERRVAKVEKFTDQLLMVSSEHGFAFWLGIGQVLQGWANAQRENNAAAVEHIREGLLTHTTTGARYFEPFCLGLLAEALALAGATGEGLTLVSRALAAADATGQIGTDAELHRLRSDLLSRLPCPNWTEVDACLRRALAVAREQGTRGFELRAAVGLANFLHNQGRRGEARDLLEPVYSWFTEGFDTPDLRGANALLEAFDA